MLYHFSEDGGISRFVPRQLPYRTQEPAMVWTIGAFHAPHYYLPRDCPRICLWAEESTADSDLLRFFSQSTVNRLIAVESRWLERIRSCRLYRYSFDPAPFTLHDPNAGYYTTTETVIPSAVEPLPDLLTEIISSGIELRLTPSLAPLRDDVLSSSISFSMIRMKNALL